jgi:hypothetical protein
VTIGCKRCGADVVADFTRAQPEGAGPSDRHQPVAAELDLDEGPTLVYESRPPGPGESAPTVTVAKAEPDRQD